MCPADNLQDATDCGGLIEVIAYHVARMVSWLTMIGPLLKMMGSSLTMMESSLSMLV